MDKPRSSTEGLDQFTGELEKRIPTLVAKATQRGLELRWRDRTVRLKPEDLGRFGPRQRRERMAEGRPFLDLSSGTLFVGEDDWLLYLTVKPQTSSRLTPYQCALLGKLLVSGLWKEFVPATIGQQVDLIAWLRLETGLDLPPMAMSRFLEQLSAREILVGDDEPKMNLQLAVETVRSDFQYSKVGKEESYAGSRKDVQQRVLPVVGSRIVEGVAGLLARESSAIIEPVDYLVARDAIGDVRKTLGGPVSKNYKGERVLVRTANRVPLELLTAGFETLQPLLGSVVAMKSSSAVGREAGREVYERWKRRICAG